MKKIFSIVIFFVVAVFVSSGVGGELKLGYVNLQKALNECDAGIRAKDELKKEFEKHESELNSKQEELKKMKEEIDQKGSVWKKETREAKEKELQARGQELQKQYMQYSDELNKKRVRKEEAILNAMKDIIKKTAKEKGYTFIFESSLGGIIHAPEDADITQDVIKEANKTIKD